MAIVSIKGMSCPHCVASTKKALEKIPGISDVEVSLEKNEAKYSGEVDTSIINETITRIGFKVVR
jgi:copper chaperone